MRKGEGGIMHVAKRLVLIMLIATITIRKR